MNWAIVCAPPPQPVLGQRWPIDVIVGNAHAAVCAIGCVPPPQPVLGQRWPIDVIVGNAHAAATCGCTPTLQLGVWVGQRCPEDVIVDMA